MILYQCENCGTNLESPDSMIGETEKCPSCGTRMPVPSKSPLNVGLAILASAIGFSLSIMSIMGLCALVHDVLLIPSVKFITSLYIFGTISFGIFLSERAYVLLYELNRKRHERRE